MHESAPPTAADPSRVAVPFDPADPGGLTDEEAARRHVAEGPNELPFAKKRGPLRDRPRGRAGSRCSSSSSPAARSTCSSATCREALLLLGFVFVVVGITFVQERKTERALDALRDLSSPRALVVRSGGKRRIAGREVVRGDVLLLSEGDRVPADAVVRSATSLSVDESLLTGESVPVGKSAVREASWRWGRPGATTRPSSSRGRSS